MKRLPFLLSALCIFACAWFLFWPTSKEVKGEIPSMPQVENDDLGHLDSGDIPPVVLRADIVVTPVFVDKLTGAEVDGAKIHYNSVENGSRSSFPSSQIDFNVRKAVNTYWSYSLPSTNGGRLMEVPTEDSKNDQGQFVLPWLSGISFKPLSGSYSLLKAAEVTIAFPNEMNWSRIETGEFSNMNLVAPSQSIDAKLAVYEAQFQPLQWANLEETPEGYRLTAIETSGRCLLKVQHPVCGEAFLWADLFPGVRVEIESVMTERPIFEGIVFDEEGNPVPRAFVHFMVQLNPEAPNLHVRPGDASGGRSALGSGDDWIYLLKKKTRTDEEGKFKLDVPPGVRFAVEVISPNRQAYAYQVVGPVVPGSIPTRIEVELILQPQGGLEVQCLDPNGEQVTGVELAIRIGSDQWGRSYPLIISNREEPTLFPWLPPEPTTIGIFVVRNKVWESAGELAQIIDVDGTPDQVLTVHVKPVKQPENNPKSGSE